MILTPRLTEIKANSRLLTHHVDQSSFRMFITDVTIVLTANALTMHPSSFSILMEIGSNFSYFARKFFSNDSSWQLLNRRIPLTWVEFWYDYKLQVRRKKWICLLDILFATRLWVTGQEMQKNFLRQNDRNFIQLKT